MSPKRTDREKAERRRRREEDEGQSLEELAASATEARAAAMEGLECPRCGCRDFRVIETERLYHCIRRRRVCRRCGWRTTTVEKMAAPEAENNASERFTPTYGGKNRADSDSS
ncbi:MAG TPA: hypothetical protein PLP01_14605 [Phycisphaerae bacterium]|nr:hypothetical protein [Phycisphaerae bacterium]HOI56476.1 hypothetical protein [Phycisphaerae bacterium]